MWGMPNYHSMYRVGFRPWERYGAAAAASISAMLDREEDERDRPPGRALDVGCGRGQYAPELARRGWDTVGIDHVAAAIDEARARAAGAGVRYVVGDVTDPPDDLGSFDFFLDIGCFQGFNDAQRRSVGRALTRLARPGATLLQLSFGPSRWRRLVGGVSAEQVVDAFPAWQVVAVDAATTDGLGWPMNRTRPLWHRLRLRPE